MPKLKSHSGAKKRFKRSATGKWKYKKAGKRHLLTPSSSNAVRQGKKPAYLNETDGAVVRRALPYG